MKRMTDVFKRFDDDRDGYVTLSFEEFLTGKFFLSRFFLSWIEKRGSGVEGCLVLKRSQLADETCVKTEIIRQR